MAVIYSKFYALEPEKQERIINAALQEFTRRGYKDASTNVIAQEAGISKGSLFNYFQSKRSLYLFLLEYIVGIIEEIYDQVDMSETDILRRIRNSGLIKYRVMKNVPQAFDFLKNAAHEDADEVKSEIQQMSKSVIEKGLTLLHENIDLTKFRDDIDIEKAMNIINWIMLGFAERQTNQLDSFEDIDTQQLKEWDDYAEIIRRCFYKEGE